MEFLSNAEVTNLLQFIADRDADLVQKACAGMGTNDDLLISVLSSRTKTQIQAIDAVYRAKYGKPLKEEIKSECSGNYGKFLSYLCETRAEFLSSRLKSAMGGMGCNRDIVNEIFCLSSNEDLAAMRSHYEQKHDSNLADRLRKELSGSHEYLILLLLTSGRSELAGDAASHAQTMQEIISKGSGMLSGLKESAQQKIAELLCSLSPAQCVAMKGGYRAHMWQLIVYSGMGSCWLLW